MSFRSVLRFLLAAPCAALLLAPGCGGGGGSDNNAALTVALADAPIDDVTSFNVTVSAISLTQDSGAVHSILATPIVVDLATLSQVSQIVDIGLLDPGTYTSASLTLNFTNAACFLNGNPLAAAIVDEAGVPLTGAMTIPIDLAAAPFTAMAGVHHVLDLDFNFDESLIVDLTGNSVEVVPSIQARFDRSDQNALVAYGEALSLDTSTSTAVMELESLAKVQLRQISLAFDGNTVFQINGVPFVGSAGISVLAGQPVGVWFQAYGVAQPGYQQLAVTYLEVGTGTWNGVQSLVDGYVVGRTGGAGADPALTVIGSSTNAAHTVQKYNTTFTVLASHAVNTTKVVLRGSASTFTTDAIDVGQHIQAYGTLVANTLDATAAGGILRAQATPLSGTAVATPVGTTLILDVQRVGPLDQALFTWADSGTSPPDPNNFAFEIGSLGSGMTINASTPLIVWSNMSAVDTSVEDATATLLDDVSTGPVVFTLRDQTAGFTVATAAAAGVVTFTITGVQGLDETASLDFGFQGVQPLPTVPDPTLVAGATQAIYVINHLTSGTTDTFELFSDFVTALGAALGGSETLVKMAATGSYDAVGNAFAAESATAVLQ